MDNLYERLEDARSDSYRERVEGWIEEDSSSIKDIEEQLECVEGWIEEDANSIKDIEERLKHVKGWVEDDLNKLNS